MIEQQIVLVDVDQVVADLYPSWFGRYNKEYSDDLHTDRVTSWNMEQFVKPECGKDIFRYLSQRDLYDDVLPVHGALEGINHIRSLGFRVVFLTASNLHMGGRKLQWLIEHGFLTVEKDQHHHHDYVECVDKSLFAPVGSFMIDDYPVNLRPYQGQRVLFTQPHNANLDTVSEGMVRVNNWAQVKAFFNIMTNEPTTPN
jgi:5'(3')-deoxyribonucleotidase